MEEYINLETIVENEVYKVFKTLVICPLCKNILIEPMMCMKCQQVYCKKCIDNYSQKDEKCPNGCDTPNYQKNIGKNEILSKLVFKCVGCLKDINYNEAEKHHNSCCHYEISNFNRKKMQKISMEELEVLKKKGNKINYITSKKYY